VGYYYYYYYYTYMIYIAPISRIESEALTYVYDERLEFIYRECFVIKLE